MIQTRTVLNVVDNTDVLTVRCFKPGKGKLGLGDIVPCSVVKRVKKNKIETGVTTGNNATYKRGDVVHVLVVNTKISNNRGFINNGIRTSFGINSCILMNNSGKEGWIPVGNRITGPIPRILRQKGWSTVVARAESLV